MFKESELLWIINLSVWGLNKMFSLFVTQTIQVMSDLEWMILLNQFCSKNQLKILNQSLSFNSLFIYLFFPLYGFFLHFGACQPQASFTLVWNSLLTLHIRKSYRFESTQGWVNDEWIFSAVWVILITHRQQTLSHKMKEFTGNLSSATFITHIHRLPSQVEKSPPSRI